MKLEQLHRAQPMAIKKQVWQVDEHFGKDNKTYWYNGTQKKVKPYHWPKP